MKYTEEELFKFYIEPNDDNIEYCFNCNSEVPVIREEFVEEFDMEFEITKTTTCSICECRIETIVSHKTKRA